MVQEKQAILRMWGALLAAKGGKTMAWMTMTWMRMTWMRMTWMRMTWMRMTWMRMTWMTRTWIRLSILALALAATGGVAAAQDDFPSKPVHIYVPYPPGGAVDI